eukprot:1681-Eustigmatos_ZCMA.PRE.1
MTVVDEMMMRHALGPKAISGDDLMFAVDEMRTCGTTMTVVSQCRNTVKGIITYRAGRRQGTGRT